MATQVFTRSTCDRCGKVDERRGAEGDVPPVGWALLKMTWRQHGPGWTNNHGLTRELCDECARHVRGSSDEPTEEG